MKEVKVEVDLLYLKIFKSDEFDCIIFVYLDKKNKVISMNYHWGSETIKPSYMEFNKNGEATKLYNLFLGVMKSHSPKIYDLVIGACSIIDVKNMEIGQLETKVAEEVYKSKKIQTKLDKILKLSKEI